MGARVWFLTRMAVDVKSRAKRYEKLDFLGEGQVRPWAEFSRRQAQPGHRWLVSLVTIPELPPC